MAQVNFRKVTTLPGTLEADTFYFVENGTYTESYLTSSTGVARSIGNSTMINALVNAALSSLPAPDAPVQYVATIAERNAMTPEGAAFVLVQDASADPTVDAGAALYAWNPTTEAWLKVSEYESMDVQLTWTALQGKPNSSPAQIDSAVAASHSHANKAVLDGIGSNADGLTYNGQPVNSWATQDW